MSRATATIWDAAGRPTPVKPSEDVAGVCYLCASPMATGSRVKDVCGSTFNDHDVVAAPWSTHVCQACTWCLEGKPPDTIRMWSLVYREDTPAPPSNPKAVRQLGPNAWQGSAKSEPLPIVEILTLPPTDGSPWLVSIADSGHIHTLPFTAVNYGTGRWTVRIERETVTATPSEWQRLCHAAASLVCAGYHRNDVLTGDPHPSKLVKHGIAVWRCHDADVRPYRGGPLLRLALFLLTRGDTREPIRDITRGDRHPPHRLRRRSGAGHDAVSPERHNPADGLVAPRPERFGDGGELRRVVAPPGEQDGGQARRGGHDPGQLSLDL